MTKKLADMTPDELARHERAKAFRARDAALEREAAKAEKAAATPTE